MAADAEADAGIGDSTYLGMGQRWEDDLYRTLRRSRTVAWIVASLALGAAVACLGLVAVMLPLKQFEPYVVTVDRTTGYLEVARALKEGPLEQSEAVTIANVVRFIRARETYDPRMIKDNFDLAALLSAGAAREELVRLWASSNAQRPDKLYGRETTAQVFVKSASFLNARTVQVRFDTIERTMEREVARHWVGTIKFRYTAEPQKNSWRFDNPLGFQVIDYRRDQEAFSTTNDAGAGR